MKHTILQTIGMDVLADTGSPIRVLEISKTLSRKSHKIFITSLCHGRSNHRKIDGVSITRIPSSAVISEEGRTMSEVSRLVSLNKKVIVKNNIDIIHSHLFTAANSAYIIKKNIKIPYIYDMHSLFPDERLDETPLLLNRARLMLRSQLEKKIRHNADYIVATSDTMKNYLINKGYKKVESVPVGVDTGFFRPMKKDFNIVRKYNLEDKKVVVYSGNTNPYQGLGNIIESLPYAIMEDKNIVFMIIGGGKDLEKYKTRAIRLGVSKNIIFTGEQPYKTMPTFLSIADVCMSMRTSTFAGNMTFPTKLTTYMSAGKPTICTSTGDQKNICRENDIGFLVGSEDPKKIGKTITGSLSNPSLLIKKGKTARKVALKKYSWDVLCKKYEKIYNIISNT